MTKGAEFSRFPENLEYWKATKDNRILFRRCIDCGKPHYYPRQFCPFCFGDTQWEESSGIGNIYSYSTIFRADTPYCAAYVTLAEGFTMFTEIVDVDRGEVRIDQAVKAEFRETESGQAIPVFARVDLE